MRSNSPYPLRVPAFPNRIGSNLRFPVRGYFDVAGNPTATLVVLASRLSWAIIGVISNVSTFCGIAKQKSVLDDTGMNTKTRRPRIGDLVGIAGFLGRFEVIQVGLDGAMTDLKHLGSPGPDYIERDILFHELIYLSAQKLDASANRSGERVSSR